VGDKKFLLDNQVFRIAPPQRLPCQERERWRTFCSARLKIKNCGHWSLNSLIFLTPGRAKSLILLWFSTFLTGQTLGALNRFFHKKLDNRVLGLVLMMMKAMAAKSILKYWRRSQNCARLVATVNLSTRRSPLPAVNWLFFLTF